MIQYNMSDLDQTTLDYFQPLTEDGEFSTWAIKWNCPDASDTDIQDTVELVKEFHMFAINELSGYMPQESKQDRMVRRGLPMKTIINLTKLDEMMDAVGTPAEVIYYISGIHEKGKKEVKHCHMNIICKNVNKIDKWRKDTLVLKWERLTKKSFPKRIFFEKPKIMDKLKKTIGRS